MQANNQYRVPIAIISNSHTPYRTYLHSRIAREIPKIKLWSIYSHERSNSPWSFDEAVSDEIGVVQFGTGESSDHQASFRFALREWRKGGKIIKFLQAQHVRFVLVMGYNDVARLRIICWCRQNGIECWLFGDSNILTDNPGMGKKWIKQLYVSRVINNCSGIFSCGSLGRRYFIKYGAKPARCLYFPYEPNYRLLQEADPDKIEEVGSRFCLAPGRRRLLFCGRLIPLKRPDLVIDAFIQIADERPDWDLLMVGEGPLRDPLKSLLPSRLNHRVTWTGFLDDQPSVNALYRLSDALILPSDYEPWAVVLNEAAASGLAIISSDVVGAAAELVQDGVNGYIFSKNDLATLSSCLLKLTEPFRIDAFKAASLVVLKRWREKADPVDGVKQALRMSGLV